MMSMRNNAVLGLVDGIVSAEQPASSSAWRTLAGAGDVDIDVVLIFRIDHQRMRVRAAAALHGGDLLGIREVADVEDADAAEPVRDWEAEADVAAAPARLPGQRAPGGGRRRRHITGRQRDSLRAAVEASIGRLRRHEQQMAVHRYVSLTAGADQRSPQLDLRRVVDVVEIDAVVVADKKMVRR